MSGTPYRIPPGPSGGQRAMRSPTAGQPLGRMGGIGGVAPDGGNSGHLFTVKYAGEIFNHYRPASRHEKQGLCGQLNNGYYFGIIGKSFTPIISGVQYTSYQLDKQSRLSVLRQQTRKEQGARMRSMYLSLGMNRAACAKFLHVTERTLHNWESGQHAIPYTAYKLLRLHACHELYPQCRMERLTTEGAVCASSPANITELIWM